MKKITLLLVFLITFVTGNYAQCINQDQYPSTDVTSNNSGMSQQIATCNYTVEHSSLVGLLVGEDYIFTCVSNATAADKYITVTDANDEVIAFGDSPLLVENITASEVHVHYTEGSDCSGANSCHTTTLQIVLTCPVPLNGLVGNVTTTSAGFTWEPGGSETAWEAMVQLGSDPMPSPDTAGTAVNGTPEFSAIGLTPATSYSFYVRANCGSEFSPWTQAYSFDTACLPIAEFFQNFDTDANDIPVCWGRILRGPSISLYSSINPVTWNSVHSAPNAIQLYNDSANTNENDIILVSPNLSSLVTGNHRLKFWAKGSGSIQVGTLDENSNSATFNMIEEVALTDTATQFTIDFSSYSGTDPLIGFRMSAPGTYYSQFIDDAVWEVAPTCPDITDLAVSATDVDSATFTWVGNAETQWNVAVGATTDSDPSVLPFVVSNDTTKTVSGLAENTSYNVWVRSVCAGNDNGAWIGPVLFKTACSPVVNFSETFDGVTSPAIPDCWSKILRGPTLSQYASINTVTFQPFSSPNAVELYNSSSNTDSDDIILVSPNVSSLATGNHRLKFNAKGSGSLQVGTLDSNTNAATFSMMEEVAVTNNGWHEYVVDFSSYTGTDTYVALRYVSPNTYNSIDVDNLVWEVLPTCPDVTEITVASVSTDGATFTWVSNGTETTWDVAVGDTSVTDPGTLTFVTSNETTKTVSGLTDNTTYKVWVRSVCAGNDNGAWIGPILFKTDCLPVANFFEDFDSTTPYTLTSCWTAITRGPSISQYAQIRVIDYDQVHSDPNTVQLLNDSSSTTDNDVILVSPNLSTLSAGTHRVKFWAKGSGTVQIGTLDSNTNAALFSQLDEITLTDTATQYAIDFTSYTGTDHYIGFRMSVPGTYYSQLFDDIRWEVAPTCADVTDVFISDATTSGATVSWSPGGAETAWQVGYVEGPATDPTTISTTLPATDPALTLTGLTDATLYSVWVRSVCPGNDYGAWIGPYSFTTQCLPSGTPFTEDFENSTTGESPACGSVLNLGNSQNQWFVDNNPGSGFTSKTLRYSYDFSNAADTWYFTRGVYLTAGTEYTITYRYGNNAGFGGGPNGYPEDLTVMAGIGASPDNMSVAIADYVQWDNGVPTDESITFTVPETGNYNFGYHCHSAANEYYVFVDDIHVDVALSTNLPTKETIGYYPNPVKDVLNLSYTQNISTVAVYNLLGQKVLDNTVNANSAKVNMSKLSGGSYLVKVTTVDNQTKTIKVIKE
ncbi:MAG: choice-of-anchor J domain-containing protein [Flavobacterium sp.]|nr:choice-of-anchor J domain-containing protein [Flavobacterium sp.]